LSNKALTRLKELHLEDNEYKELIDVIDKMCEKESGLLQLIYEY